MIKELQETIKKHLPEAVAGQMKEFIEQAGKDVAELEVLRKQIEADKINVSRYVESAAILRKEVSDLKDQIKICEDCKTRYTELIYKQKELVMFEKCADFRVNDMKELVSLVFKSPVYRKYTTSNRGVPVPGSRDCSGYIQDHHESEETKETED